LTQRNFAYKPAKSGKKGRKRMAASKPLALLFDLGGVILDIDFDRVLRAWQPVSRLSFEEMKRAFQFDAHYERHERGEIAGSEYFGHLASKLGLQADEAQIAAGWNAVFVGEIVETTKIVQSMRTVLPCHAFTNTNATHQAGYHSLFPGLQGSFERIFASHEIGLRKPERRAFAHVAQAIGVAPASILFFDDSPANIDGALAAGMQAVQVRGAGDVKNALAAAGFAC
jgi:putative hydrolase of the HAD superfamily